MKRFRLTPIISGVFLSICFYLNGCAGTGGIDWDKRIGNYSYDDMRSDYGEPWKTEVAADGSKTCDWAVYIRQSWHTHTDYVHDEYRNDFPIAGERDPSGGMDYFYHMTFDRKGLLLKWQKVRAPK